MPKPCSARTRFRFALGDQSGQSLILTALAMTLFLALSALAIDVSTWYQRHHSSQVAVDAAALAAANCLANGGNSGNTCTSTTDTADAQTVATSIAAADGATIPTSDVTVDTTSHSVTVTSPVSAPALLASIAGVHTASLHTVTSAAAYQTSTAGSAWAIFGMNDSSCGSNGNGNYSVEQTAGSWTIDGGVHSNTSLFLDPGGSSYQELSYGNVGSGSGATACSPYEEGGGGTFNDGQPVDSGYIPNWPVPYNTSADPLPACTVTYNGSGTWQIGTPASGNQVYCYPNGTIQLTGSSYPSDTFICGEIEPQGGGITMDAENYPTNKLLVYATDTGDAFNFGTGGDINFEGDIDTPNGTIDINAGSESYRGLLEGQYVILGGGSNGTLVGDGPDYPGTGGAATDWLTQ